MEKPPNKRTRDLGDIQEATSAKSNSSGKARRLGASAMKKIILFLFLFTVSLNAASLKIVPVQQKVLPNGNAYGLESGIYFELTDLHPFIMYKLEYSKDLKNWTELVQLGTYKMAMTSPHYTWSQLPKNKCFFRIVEAW